MIYQPRKAAALVKKHAKHYLQGRRSQLDKIDKQMDANPLLVAPFDAELFGHWWFEGPSFLAEIFHQANNENVSFSRLRDCLADRPYLQLCDPCPSSWGQGGYHNYWLNESNSWVVPELSRASNLMIRNCSVAFKNEYQIRLLRQAARE